MESNADTLPKPKTDQYWQQVSDADHELGEPEDPGGEDANESRESDKW